jgi:Ca-activated chloride channel family protein
MHIRLVTDDQFKRLAREGVLREVLIDGVPAWESDSIAADALSDLPRKIDRVKDALRIVVEHLRPGDHFALVAFAREAVTLIPSTSGAQKLRVLDALEEIEQIKLGDDTYIGQGMARGFEELEKGSGPGLADRMLVLTDGFTQDEAACRDWAIHARQARIPISTMGLGGEFNEELMIPVADQTGGEAYLLEEPEDIPVAFAKELKRAQAVRYRNLELKLRPTPGMEVRAAYRVRPSIVPLETVNDGGSYGFSLGDLVAGEEPAVILELIVPPRAVGAYRLAQALLAYDNPGGGQVGEKARVDVTVEYTDDLVEADQVVAEVMHVVEALSAYKLQRRAQDDLATGDVESATRKLRAAATRLLDMGQEDLAEEMTLQAAELERHGQADPQRAKRLRYETRKLTQRLSDDDG